MGASLQGYSKNGGGKPAILRSPKLRHSHICSLNDIRGTQSMALPSLYTTIDNLVKTEGVTNQPIKVNHSFRRRSGVSLVAKTQPGLSFKPGVSFN